MANCRYLLITLLFALSSFAYAEKTSITDRAALPLDGDIVGVHDPYMIKFKNKYYVFCTGRGIRVRTSTDLKHWTREDDVFDPMPEWSTTLFPFMRDLWAPEVFYLGGKFHLYYAASRFGINDSALGHATNPTLDQTSPAYKWTDHGPILRTRPEVDNYNAIDATVIVDMSGRAWMGIGSYWTGIKLTPLDAKTGELTDLSTTHTIATRPEETSVEAAFFFAKNGMYYLFVSFDQCCQGVRSTYRTMVGRSAKVTGPYVDREGKPMTQGGGTELVSSTERWRGPGHGSVFSENGQEYWVHHAYDAENDGRPTLRIMKLKWDGQGWPVPAAD